MPTVSTTGIRKMGEFGDRARAELKAERLKSAQLTRMLSSLCNQATPNQITSVGGLMDWWRLLQDEQRRRIDQETLRDDEQLAGLYNRTFDMFGKKKNKKPPKSWVNLTHEERQRFRSAVLIMAQYRPARAPAPPMPPAGAPDAVTRRKDTE